MSESPDRRHKLTTTNCNNFEYFAYFAFECSTLDTSLNILPSNTLLYTKESGDRPGLTPPNCHQTTSDA